MLCPSCGRDNRENSRVCAACGVIFNPAPVVHVDPPASQTMNRGTGGFPCVLHARLNLSATQKGLEESLTRRQVVEINAKHLDSVSQILSVRNPAQQNRAFDSLTATFTNADEAMAGAVDIQRAALPFQMGIHIGGGRLDEIIAKCIAAGHPSGEFWSLRQSKIESGISRGIGSTRQIKCGLRLQMNTATRSQYSSRNPKYGGRS